MKLFYDKSKTTLIHGVSYIIRQLKCEVSWEKLHRKQPKGTILPDICASGFLTKLE